MPGGTPASPKIAAVLAVAPAMLAQKTRGLYPAPAGDPRGDGRRRAGRLRHRRCASRARKLAKLMVGQIAKNMIQAFFFDLNAIKSGKSRPKGLPRVEAARRSASSAPA